MALPDKDTGVGDASLQQDFSGGDVSIDDQAIKGLGVGTAVNRCRR